MNKAYLPPLFALKYPYLLITFLLANQNGEHVVTLVGQILHVI